MKTISIYYCMTTTEKVLRNLIVRSLNVCSSKVEEFQFNERVVWGCSGVDIFH